MMSFPLRPLLYAAGAAGAAAGLYYYMKSGDEERTDGQTHTPLTEESDILSSPDPTLMSDRNRVPVTHTDSTVPEDSLAETERRYQQMMKTNTQLEKKNSYLMSKVNVLQEELSLSRIRWKDIMREREQEQVFRADAERINKEVLESNAQLEREKSDLMSQVDTLRGSMLEMNRELSETRANCDEMRTSLAEAEKTYQVLLNTSEELVIEKLNLNAEMHTLRDSLLVLEEELSETRRMCEELTREREREQASLAEAERKRKEVMESYVQLEEEKSDLMSQVNTLRCSVQQLSEEQFVTYRKCNEIRNSLEKAEVQYMIMRNSSAKLENENCKLKYRVNILQDSVLELEEMLSDAEKKCDAIKQEKEQEREAHSDLKSQYNLMTLMHNKLFLGCEQEQADGEKKYKEEMASSAQQENETSDLSHRVDTLQGFVQEMNSMLAEKYNGGPETTTVLEQQNEERRILEDKLDLAKEAVPKDPSHRTEEHVLQ